MMTRSMTRMRPPMVRDDDVPHLVRGVLIGLEARIVELEKENEKLKKENKALKIEDSEDDDSDYTMNKTMNAEEYLTELRELDEGLWEQVLDTITDHHNKTIPDNDDGMKYYITLYDEGKVVLELYEQDE